VKPFDLANHYMEIIFSGENLDELHQIFSQYLSFTGLFFQFIRADDYINSLKDDPLLDFNYEIIKSFEDENSACLIYRFIKHDVETIMAQLFELKDDKISRIELIFDAINFL